MADVVVIGSLNMDLVTVTQRMPQVGETRKGIDFRMIPGGKGANQAVAAARLDAKVTMVGCVGDDYFGNKLQSALATDNVDISLIRTSPDIPTGIASITVDAGGANSIVIVQGANALCSLQDVDAAEKAIRESKAVMLQLEVPIETVEYAARLAAKLGKLVILDPAPAQPLSPELLSMVDILTPNESEAESLTGRKIVDLKSSRLAAADILGGGAKVVLLKLGAQGVLYAKGNQMEHITGMVVETVDTTAAGDAFNAGLAVALAEGRPIFQALKFANVVGALSTTRIGAQTSLPKRAEVEQFMLDKQIV